MTNKIDFRVLLIGFGVALFLFAPGTLFWDETLFSVYPRNILYPLWAPGINYFDIYWFTCAYLIQLSGLPEKITFSFFSVSIIVFFLVAWSFILIAVNGYDISIFHDGLFMACRIFIFYYIFSFCARHNRLHFLIKLVSFCVVSLVFISFGAVISMGYEGVIDGRINLLGMGPNVSSDIVIIVFGLLLFLQKDLNLPRPILYSLLLILTLYIPFSGSRRVLIYWFLLLLFYSFHIGAMRRFLIIVACSTIILASFGFVLLDEYFSDSSVISIVRFLETFEQIRTGAFSDGRSEMYQIAWSVINDFPFGLGGSDWLIQTEMQKIGVGSHTHNIFLQSYLKIGPLLLLPLVAVTWFFAKNNLKGVGYIWAIVFLQNLLGHGFWNQKYLFLIVLLLVISLKQIPPRGVKFVN